MTFNSPLFIFAFLPVVWLGDLWLKRLGRPSLAIAWLVLASMAFYAVWRLGDLPIVAGSIAFNFLIARLILRRDGAVRLWLLILGIAADLALLAHYKYAAFAIANLNAMVHLTLPVPAQVLPLGISFFTFTQIAFLVDVYRREAREVEFGNFSLFVSFFPHLMAGPILHHGEIMPQLQGPRPFDAARVFAGGSLFAIGLFKKVVLADGIAGLSTGVFTSVQAGLQPTFEVAWAGALAYTFQLYFDFSGYSDMALGLAALFGVRFPLNFDSPYKATSIIDFWRRWHMTLSAFLRDYVYIPLGGNRHGPWRRYANLVATMLLGGLWHGASWTFVLWGGLHGLYLLANHAWRAAFAGRPPLEGGLRLAMRAIGWLFTFLAVVVAWVLFRAESLASAVAMYRGMLGWNGTGAGHAALPSTLDAWPLLVLLAMVLCLPNSQQMVAALVPAEPDRARGRWRLAAAAALGAGLFWAFKSFFSTAPTPFLYSTF